MLWERVQSRKEVEAIPGPHIFHQVIGPTDGRLLVLQFLLDAHAGKRPTSTTTATVAKKGVRLDGGAACSCHQNACLKLPAPGHDLILSDPPVNRSSLFRTACVNLSSSASPPKLKQPCSSHAARILVGTADFMTLAPPQRPDRRVRWRSEKLRAAVKRVAKRCRTQVRWSTIRVFGYPTLILPNPWSLDPVLRRAVSVPATIGCHRYRPGRWEWADRGHSSALRAAPPRGRPEGRSWCPGA